MSPSRSAILEVLAEQAEPVTQAAVTHLVGLHPNTVRDHLEALVRLGLARRDRAEPSGRGRPAWLYQATGSEPGGTEYAGLAAALAATIARTSAAPREAATHAGEEWGHELARDRGAAASPAEAARAQVVDLLDDLGFAPESDADRPEQVRLTRCPLLAAAHRHPEVVCGVHLGIVRGALEEYGADPAGSDLLPFAEPGACRLVVPPFEVRPA
jgi:predicted ArsR family transcriptional regulator